ncbi:pyridoxamine 5'-phosphate oxidase family protein [Nocardia sp. alder85J]|uniref:pyridoxamine 5'-phosphate oxidase family protein n=1 Tax=Nocardia sp. alder85J TaxID=2862949 RepID=UPI001CD55E45|nr:pyridoxamine 5'-phosphate oxidase family protein [Nocardia sp. alder85J]MCX4094984.1 pyridoxamine 5'-phosphate oxidase family protein [Nocardia sp. alder85J]
MGSVFHDGELAVQQRMGQGHIAARVGRGIRADIPGPAAAFLADQPMVVIATADDAGRPWVGQIIGLPGFAQVVDARTILLGGRPAAGDPLVTLLRTRRRVGLIALQPQTRRRVRINGVAEPDGEGIRLTTEQVYSNCPQYITRRRIVAFEPALPGPPVRAASLNSTARQIISAADSFFVGSADPDGNADASHRGGNPGFLRVLSPTQLRWPDYRGNSMFMTLGNIVTDPRCGLLVPDWATGATLHLTGLAEITWDEATFAPGAQCSIDFTVTEAVSVPQASPLRWGEPELSPVNPA